MYELLSVSVWSRIISHYVFLQVLFETVAITLSQRHKHWFRVLYNTLLVYSRGSGGTSAISKSYRQAVQSMLIWIVIFFSRPHKVYIGTQSYHWGHINIAYSLLSYTYDYAHTGWLVVVSYKSNIFLFIVCKPHELIGLYMYCYYSISLLLRNTSHFAMLTSNSLIVA